MLRLHKITITHFKNYEFNSFGFNENVVGICGLNGKGKTNLLDAIYYCCFTKSYFSHTDQYNVNFGQEGFRLEGAFDREGEMRKLVCINRGTARKEFYIDDVPYEKLSKHIGLFPAVMIAPDDIELIIGPGEERRRYLDTVLSQLDGNYLQELITYNKILVQRNSLLKKMDESGSSSDEILEILDRQLLPYGKIIHQKRSQFLEELIPLVQQFYKQISNDAETVSMIYKSQLNDHPFDHLLKVARAKDLVLQRSTSGIHKDELAFLLDGQNFRNVASQGQRKSLLFALRLAEFEMLKSNKGFAPLLLLDDVFEKLDDSRMQQLLGWVCKSNSGNVFITDTHRDRLEAALEKLGMPFQLIELV